jgi:molybdopterin converting factor small subunit
MGIESESRGPAVGSSEWHRQEAKKAEEKEEAGKRDKALGALREELGAYQGEKREELKRELIALPNEQKVSKLRDMIGDFENSVSDVALDRGDWEKDRIELDIKRARMDLMLEIISEQLETGNK